MPNKRRVLTYLTTTALWAAGCAQPLAPQAVSLSVDLQEEIRMLGETPVQQWSSGLVTSAEIEQARVAKWAAAEPTRELQTISTIADFSSTGFAGKATTGKLSSAPSYHFYTKECYWITEDGWLLKYNRTTGAKDAFKVGTTDTFPRTSLTLSNDGKRVYVISKQGKLYAIHTADGTQVTNSPIAMGNPYVGDADPNVNLSTSVFIDPLASRPDGQSETLYAITTDGKIKRFVVGARGADASIQLVQTYTTADGVPIPSSGSFANICRTSPIAVRGKVYFGLWRRSTSGVSANDEGGLLAFDTGCRTYSTSPSTPVAANSYYVPMAFPVWAPPALDFDAALNPTLAFFPAGASVVMVDLVSTAHTIASTVPLVVDKISPTQGTLLNYDYANGPATPRTVYPKSDANGYAALTIYGNNAKDVNFVGAARAISTANSSQVYGYMKFNVPESELIEGGTLRTVDTAYLRLRCTRAASSLLNDPVTTRAFRVGNATAGGVDWYNNSIANFADRPRHMLGQTFDQTPANLTANASWELSPLHSGDYNIGTDYNWLARGKVTTGNADYSFALVQDTHYEDISLGGLLGLLGIPSPIFRGGNTDANRPRLVLHLSNAGITNPTLSNPVSIDAVRKQIFVASTNALYKLSYAGTTFADKTASFEDDANSFFVLSHLGRLNVLPGTTPGPTYDATTAGLGTGSRFVENTTAPLYDGTYVYMQDNHPTHKRTALNRFIPGGSGVQPTLDYSVLLPDTGGEARASTPYLTYDYESKRLMAASYDPAGTSGHVWIMDRR